MVGQRVVLGFAMRLVRRVDDIARHLDRVLVVFSGLVRQHHQHVLGRQHALLLDQRLVGIGREAAIDRVDRPQRSGRVHAHLVRRQRDHRPAGHGDIGDIGHHARILPGIVVTLDLIDVLFEFLGDHVRRPGIAAQRMQDDHHLGPGIGLADRGDSFEGLVKGDLLLGAVTPDEIVAQVMDEVDQDRIAGLDLLAQLVVFLARLFIVGQAFAAQFDDLLLVRLVALAQPVGAPDEPQAKGHDKCRRPGQGVKVDAFDHMSPRDDHRQTRCRPRQDINQSPTEPTSGSYSQRDGLSRNSACVLPARCPLSSARRTLRCRRQALRPAHALPPARSAGRPDARRPGADGLR